MDLKKSKETHAVASPHAPSDKVGAVLRWMKSSAAEQALDKVFQSRESTLHAFELAQRVDARATHVQ